MMNKVAVLLTCFNRKDKTLECLARLKNQTDMLHISPSIYLVDDGCTDGTGEAVSHEFPDVNIIQGNGALYWNGGMRLAWSHSLEKGYDFYLWINDDSLIYPDSLSRIVETYYKLLKNGAHVGAVLGTMIDPVDKKPTYGGRLRNSRFNPVSFGAVLNPGSNPVHCDFVNGNFTLIPAISVNKIGILSDTYTHSMGDFDYGLRLKKAGFDCWVAPGVYGECEKNSKSRGCRDATLSVTERVDKMHNLAQLPPVNEWMHFIRLHGGYAWPLLWVRAWVRGQFPFIWAVLRSEKISDS